jgi:hypothetical protein
MDKKKLFKILAYLVITLFFVNYIAVKLYWYYTIWWFDMPMHFFGGFFIGLALIWLLLTKIYAKNPSIELSFELIGKILLGVFVIGGSWEIYEILVNNAIAQNPFNTLDTISDVFFDLAGGAFAIYYCYNYLYGKNG